MESLFKLLANIDISVRSIESVCRARFGSIQEYAQLHVADVKFYIGDFLCSA